MINKDYAEQLSNYQVPKNPILYITEDDPRNTAEFLKENPGIHVVPSNAGVSVSQYDWLAENEYDLTSDANVYYDPNFASYSTEQTDDSAPAPTQLSIDSSAGYRLQTDSNDGSVYYVANLTFEGVDEAYDYEVRINIA